jgi:hypothetical protein
LGVVDYLVHPDAFSDSRVAAWLVEVCAKVLVAPSLKPEEF